MRNRNPFVTFACAITITITFALAACGGKIAGDQRASSGDDSSHSPASSSGFDPAPAPSATAQPTSPFAPFTAPPMSGLAQPGGGPSVDDACAAICERNGKCGADQTDCAESCSNEIQGAVACAALANAYIQCYARNLVPGCAALPPACEGDYCAYTICAGKVVPDYCHG